MPNANQAQPLKGKKRSKRLRELIRDAGMMCGAYARTTGQPCKRPPESLSRGNGRCYLHGARSTGPKTVDGLARTLAALLAGFAKWTAAGKPRKAKIAAPERSGDGG